MSSLSDRPWDWATRGYRGLEQIIRDFMAAGVPTTKELINALEHERRRIDELIRDIQTRQGQPHGQG